jgi:hypothetical protein
MNTLLGTIARTLIKAALALVEATAISILHLTIVMLDRILPIIALYVIVAILTTTVSFLDLRNTHFPAFEFLHSPT